MILLASLTSSHTMSPNIRQTISAALPMLPPSIRQSIPRRSRCVVWSFLAQAEYVEAGIDSVGSPGDPGDHMCETVSEQGHYHAIARPSRNGPDKGVAVSASAGLTVHDCSPALEVEMILPCWAVATQLDQVGSAGEWP